MKSRNTGSKGHSVKEKKMQRINRRLSEGFLFTDMYQLTMAQLYFRAGIHEKKAQFDHFSRKYPNYGSHQAGFCVNAGMGWLLDWMSGTILKMKI